MNLIFDADDTLWENNVLFESIIEAFIDAMARNGRGRSGIRAVLDAIERANSHAHGYGSAVFERSLAECMERLREPYPLTGEERAWITGLCRALREEPVELLPGVPETLRSLALRHRLYLCTKGEPAEQQRKIGSSGLAGFFEEIVIVREKGADTYRDLVKTFSLDAGSTWMIGNSPRSDVLPALEAGLGAVLVPHPMTWSLEHAPLPNLGGRCLRLSPITALLDHF
ncbi:HAD family hydrolase [Nonomuraea typhae]|uniref:HAD family hydrolase n=1 Tax=Nonomuraea typhae TaxID=2603600 RepID=UPI0012F7D948|nr:HAD family hydrolase [Nonomuraea typhae]